MGCHGAEAEREWKRFSAGRVGAHASAIAMSWLPEIRKV